MSSIIVGYTSFVISPFRSFFVAEITQFTTIRKVIQVMSFVNMSLEFTVLISAANEYDLSV